MKQLTKKSDIEYWLLSHNIQNYSIEKNDQKKWVVYVNGDVHLHNKNLTCLPVQFAGVEGTFNVSKNKLTSLKGSPSHAQEFLCSGNLLTDLVGGPQYVQTTYIALENPLLSLNGAALQVKDTVVLDMRMLRENIFWPHRFGVEIFFMTGNTKEIPEVFSYQDYAVLREKHLLEHSVAPDLRASKPSAFKI